MPEALKKPLIGLGIVLLLVVVAFVFVGSNLDSIVKSAIEKYGTQALGADVSVGSVELDIAEGKGTIRNLRVDNPEGYSRSDALSFGELTVAFDYKSRDVKLIRAAAPEVNVEMKGSSNNFEALLAGMSSGEPTEAPEASETADPITLKIDRIEVEAARATMTSDQRDEPIDIDIDKMVFTNIEGTSDEIASQIVKQLLSKIRGSIGKVAGALAREAVEEKTEDLKEDLGDKLRDKLRD